ncbi:MAG: DNA replication/repair protein RecF [Clostridia bacterium]|nr:DNA replication/repair protein RecF [Clostridia bacterium]
MIMKVKKLTLYNYRNIPSAELTFSGEMNFLLGDNAQGKTNALEAIYLFARGKSFRGATDSELTAFGQSGYAVTLTFEKTDREETLFCSYTKKEKIRKRNGILLEKQSELLGSFRAVLFSPDDLMLIKGSPAERRRFLDVAISQCYPAYLSLYSSYNKSLEQRNALLKQRKDGFTDDVSLSVWNEALAKSAADIYFYRKEYVERLSRVAKDLMEKLSGGKEIMTLSYDSNIKENGDDRAAVEERYRHLFSAHVDRETAAGNTLFGIHRDELTVLVGGKPLKDFGSQGQQRSAVLSLKMAEGAVSRDICGDSPVYLFDDVLSELDEDRRAFLLSGMKGCQFIVTGCEKSVLGAYGDGVHFIKVSCGSFTRE